MAFSSPHLSSNVTVNVCQRNLKNQCTSYTSVIWVATDAPDPMLTMQTTGPLLLHYSSHQARVACSDWSVTNHLLYALCVYEYI